MRRLRAVVVGLVAFVPLLAPAAEATRVASSFDEGHPFGLFVDLRFERSQRLMSIGRERHDDQQVVVAPELRYVAYDHRLSLDLHAGLWHDIELHYGIPLVFPQTEEWWLSSLTSPTTSSVLNNCANANGRLVDYPTNPSACPITGAGAVSMFPGTAIGTAPSAPQVSRGGFGNMRFGLSWAAFNQLRDDTKPTWLVGFEYEAPTADRLDPTADATDTNRGAIGDRIHRYQLWTAFSRKIGLVDPYVRIYLTLPYRGPGWYSNCDHPDPSRMSMPGNCGLPEWGRVETGIQAPVVAGFFAGSEFLVLDQPAKKQRFVADVRGYTTYVSPGRYYNELSGLTKKLMYTEDYVQVGGSLAFVAGVAEYMTLRARASLGYESDHDLSSEPLGKDFACNSPSAVTGTCENETVDYLSNPAEVNPNFDYRMDLVSRQLRATAIFVFGVQVSATFTF